MEKCGGRGGGECECERGGGVWEGWRCVREVEKCSGRVEGVLKGRCVREVEVCERGKCVGGVEVWERWRCVREVEKCGGRGGGVLKGWRCVG